MEFGIPGYNDLVWDVSLIGDRLDSSTQHGLNGNLELGDYLMLVLAGRWANSDVIMLPRTSLSHLQSYLSPARFILNSRSPVGVGGHADRQVLQSRWGRRGHRE